MDVGDVRFGGVSLPYDDIKLCKVAFCVVARAERHVYGVPLGTERVVFGLEPAGDFWTVYAKTAVNAAAV